MALPGQQRDVREPALEDLDVQEGQYSARLPFRDRNRRVNLPRSPAVPSGNQYSYGRVHVILMTFGSRTIPDVEDLRILFQ